MYTVGIIRRPTVIDHLVARRKNEIVSYCILLAKDGATSGSSTNSVKHLKF